ncbi:glycosyltransferase family 8 protein [Actinoplanes sp. NPDC051633]|uniref:glycosyltransferase family 8 protein n=1 Tax=Actinoplanes sp. NPDC051633 TaxID=3155670 RepID=UPI003445E513
MNKSEVEVVVATDENYVMPTAACIRSVIDNYAGNAGLKITVLGSGLTSHSIRNLRRSWPAWCRSNFLDIGTLLRGLPIQGVLRADYTETIYAPLFLPRLLDGSRRIIFLDSDTITLKSLHHLWDMDIVDNSILAAVADDYVPTVSSRWGVQAWREQELSPSTAYFNSGVMLVDLVEWRRVDLSQDIERYLELFGDRLVQHDQEVLNGVAKGRWFKLDTLWNVTSYWRKPQRRFSGPRDPISLAKIRHFAGRDKPWRGVHDDIPDETRFFDYVDRTHWRGWRPTTKPARRSWDG